ncbi:c-type cytochrome [Maritalea sp.]|jgi:mono/diheme cytochrome c family protein|uniref:c-type cytochrome n=1 Tax=Maritalea sp. TaxID=2003361 RepID=UPI0039E666C4
MKYIVLGFFAVGLTIVAWNYFNKPDFPDTANLSGKVDVRLVELSPLAEKGKEIFDENCSACHGDNASGGDGAPPLIHDIYNPGHHGDAAFLNAVQNGVPQHHWKFGNMPPREGLTQLHVAAIVTYIRELQVANGVATAQHDM